MTLNYNLITLENVSIAAQNKVVLHDINYSITTGKVIALIGASGSGKTTFQKMILELLFEEKCWKISPKIIRLPGLRMAWINQNPALQLFKNFVPEELANNDPKKLESLLMEINSAHLLNKRCLELSQGEKTIIALLRAFGSPASVIALDEVMVNLSASKRSWLKKIILEFKNLGGTVLITEHSADILDIIDEILFLHNGSLTKIDPITAQKFLTVNPFFYQNFAPPSGMDILEIDNLRDPLIARTQSQPVTFSARAGEIVGISGDNGSGKSTLLEIICGIKKLQQGTIKWQTHELKKLRQRKNLISLVNPESMQLFLTPKVASEISISCDNPEDNFVKQLLQLFHLEDFLTRNIASLSYGEKQRLTIVLSMISNTKILLFDEPTYGMDQFTLKAFLQALKLVADQDRIVLLASHEHQLLEMLTQKRIEL